MLQLGRCGSQDMIPPLFHEGGAQMPYEREGEAHSLDMAAAALQTFQMIKNWVKRAAIITRYMKDHAVSTYV